MFLIERDAAGGYADYFFQFILALLIAAPHCLDEAWLIFCDLLHLIQCCRYISMGISVCFCTLKHIVVNRLQKLANLCCDLIQRYRNLLMRITANPSDWILNAL